ncbi:5-formyltetrahydrofolate cyclo-ligase [Usnea florida]
MAGLRAAKKGTRALMRHRLSQLSPDFLQHQSATATEILLSLPEYKNAQRIGVYLSMPKGEMGTRAIIKDALRCGKKIYVPYIYESKIHVQSKPRSAMDMVSLHSKSDYEALKPDAWGIPSVAENSLVERSQILKDFKDLSSPVSEIVDNSESISSNKGTESRRLDLIIMPGVAFDRGLGRLGHGKGFYDRFLKLYHDLNISVLGEEKMPFLVGLALDVQLLPDKIPTDASDWRLDALVVGDGSIIRSQSSRTESSENFSYLQ